jgi:hypothetical protein
MNFHTSTTTEKQTKQSTLFPQSKTYINSFIGFYTAAGPVNMKKEKVSQQ